MQGWVDETYLTYQPSPWLLLTSLLLFLGRQLDKIKAEAQEKGDLGLVAESSRSNQRMMFQPASLTAGGVFRKLKEIASMNGNSVRHRIIILLTETVITNIVLFCAASVTSAFSVKSKKGRKCIAEMIPFLFYFWRQDEFLVLC